MSDNELPQPFRRSWDPELTLAGLEADPLRQEDVNEADTAERIFREHLPVAAQSICHLAMNSSNEKTRLQASQYVVERNLGRIIDAKPLTRAKNDPFDQLLEDINNAAE